MTESEMTDFIHGIRESIEEDEKRNVGYDDIPIDHAVKNWQVEELLEYIDRLHVKLERFERMLREIRNILKHKNDI